MRASQIYHVAAFLAVTYSSYPDVDEPILCSLAGPQVIDDEGIRLVQIYPEK